MVSVVGSRVPDQSDNLASADTSHAQAYGDWKAPKYDGALLIWPDAPRLPEIACENRVRLDGADHVRIHGRPLPEVRREARVFVGHRTDAPLIATGHQCELHHPGVWVKNAVICAVADACGGAAYHVAVDTDAPKHLKLKWPGFEGPITDDPFLHGAAWSGLLEPPAPDHLEMLLHAADRGAEQGETSLQVAEILRAARAYLVDQRDAVAPGTLPALLADGQHRLDWSLGLDYSLLLLSGLLGSEAWLPFVCHMATDAPAFAAAYNRALAEHRVEAGIEGADRPMPDLTADERTIELPLWLDHLDARRRDRATLAVTDGVPTLKVDVESFAFTPDADPAELVRWLRVRRLRLAPRALSLTMFLRLCVCDLFVHGIGGGHYDQVTDRLVRDYFRLEPPTFAVATATLFHPDSLERERVCLPCLKQKGHHLAHATLGEEKAAWLGRIEAAQGFHARRDIFDEMHEARRRSLETDPAWAAWEQQMREADRRLEEEARIFDRELFYAVQPRRRLEDLVRRVRDEVSR